MMSAGTAITAAVGQRRDHGLDRCWPSACMYYRDGAIFGLVPRLGTPDLDREIVVAYAASSIEDWVDREFSALGVDLAAQR